MIAAVLHGPRDLRIEVVHDPEPASGWALVEMEAVGICGTDKAFYRGDYRPPKLPLIIGHEAVGVVVAGPSGWVGERVVTEINFVVDWGDPLCRVAYTHCPAKLTLGIDFDGAMAEKFVAKVEALHRIGGLDYRRAVHVEPLAAVLRAFKLQPLPPSARLAVVGTGPLALLAAQVARLAGAEVTVVARMGSPKARIAESLGFQVAWFEEMREEVESRRFRGMGFDAVFEACGSPECLDLAVKLVRPLGVVYAKSTHADYQAILMLRSW